MVFRTINDTPFNPRRYQQNKIQNHCSCKDIKKTRFTTININLTLIYITFFPIKKNCNKFVGFVNWLTLT